MTPDVEKGVHQACENFQSFCLLQIVAAWFADAPDPAALVDEMLAKWEATMRKNFDQAARQRAEATGIITTGGDWLDEVLVEANRIIRKSLWDRIGLEKIGMRPVCVKDHDCEADPQGCVLELQKSGKVH